MRLGNEAKVGLIVFAAFLALVAIYWFLGSFGLRTSTYQIYAIFHNVQKLDKGADVRLAGVKIGVVAEVLLTPASEARVNMLINKGNFIPEDSVATITSGAVIGDSFVEIVPGSSKVAVKPGGRLKIIRAVQLDEIMTDAGALVKDLRVATKSANQFLSDKDLLASIKGSIAELKKTAEAASLLMSSTQGLVAQTSPQIDRVFENLNLATANAVKISSDIDVIINQDARPNIGGILAQARQATGSLNEAIQEAKGLVSSFRGSSDQIVATLDKVDATVSEAQQMMVNLKDASAGIKDASTGIKDIATDQEIKNDLKATLKNAAEASAQAKELLGGLNNRFGLNRRASAPKQKDAIPDYGMSADALYNASNSNYRADVNYTFAGRKDLFYRVGLFDVGENTKFNLQGGKIVDPLTSLRYGLYASKLGVGVDKTLTPGFRLSADIYRPNDPRMELKGTLGISGAFGLTAGVRDLFSGSDKDLLLGVHYVK